MVPWFLIFAAVASSVEARSILSFPVEIRKRNFVRLSTEKCDECMTLEEFYEHNPLGFVLFYERALMGTHKYKQAIVTGWMETCNELRWSRIACGMVDMVQASDRAYAERYIDPQTAPAHIVVHNSQPVMARKDQIEGLLAKPGHKATMMSHVMDMFKDAGTMGNITVSVEVNSKEALQRLLTKHHLVVAAFIGDERPLADAFRAAAQEAVLAHGLETAVPPGLQAPEAGADSGRAGKGDKAMRAKDKSRIAFVAVVGRDHASHFGLVGSDRFIAAFVDGQLVPGGLPMKQGVKPGDSATLEAVKKVTMEAASHAAGRATGAKSEKSKARRRKATKAKSEL